MRGGNPLSKKSFTILMLLANMVLWGSAFVTSKIVVGLASAPVSASIRFGLAALIFGIFLLAQQSHPRKVSKMNLFRLFLMGATGVALYNWLFFVGLDLATATDGTIIIPAMSPVMTSLFALLFFKEKLTKIQGAGLLVASVGAILFFFSIATGSFHLERFWGGLLFLGSAVSWAIYTLIGRNVLKEIHPLISTSYAFIFGGALLILVALPQYSSTNWSQLGFDYWSIQFYMALFPTVIANFFYSYGVKNIGPSQTAMFMFFVPISGLILATVILHESLNYIQMVSSVCMILGIWLVNNKTTRQPLSIIEKNSMIRSK